MVPPLFWKGHLKLSLVTCPVAMAPATSERDKVRFHTLNRATGNRVAATWVDAVTGEPVEEEDEVKGYERAENDYVVLEDEEIEAAALPSTRTIDIGSFVARDSVDWIWFDKPHYLMPRDAVGEEAFAVIREAMAVSGVVGMARLVLYRRERAVLLEPRGKGIVLWTLHYATEMRDEREVFGPAAPETSERDPRLVTLVEELIDARTEAWNSDMTADPLREDLLDLIAARRGTREPEPLRPPASAENNVIDIMDALRRSIASERGRSGNGEPRAKPRTP